MLFFDETMGSTSVLTCLIVEDASPVREVYRRCLANFKCCFRFEYAYDLREALHKLEAEEERGTGIQFAIVDHILPDGLGVDFLQRAAELKLPLRALYCTGYNDPDVVAAVRRTGVVDGFLPKPFTPTLLQRAFYDTACPLSQYRNKARFCPCVPLFKAKEMPKPGTFFEARLSVFPSLSQHLARRTQKV